MQRVGRVTSKVWRALALLGVASGAVAASACGSQSTDANDHPGSMASAGTGGDLAGSGGEGIAGAGDDGGTDDGAGAGMADAGSGGDLAEMGSAGMGSAGMGSAGMGSAGMGTGPVPSTHCNDLVVGDLPAEVGVVRQQAPVSNGGTAFLVGTYDLVRLDMYIPTDLSAEASKSCESLAAGDAKKLAIQQSYRITSASGGQFLVEDVLQAPNSADVARTSQTVRITNTTILDPVAGTNQCVYTNLGGTETLTNKDYVRGPGFLGYDYLSAFTATADSLRIVDGASFPESGPAYCSRVYSFQRR